MSSSIEEFLSHNSQRVANSTAPANNGYYPFTGHHLISLTGPDSSKLLQGQITCNINQLSQQECLRGAICNPKGRALSNFILAEQDQGTEQAAPYLLRMHSSLSEQTLNHLKKYAAFYKTELSNEQEQYLCLGLQSDSAKERVKSIFQASTTAAMTCAHHQQSLAIQLDEQGKLFECWIHKNDLETLWPLLTEGLEPGTENQWQLTQIRAGIAELSKTTADRFTPHALNYQRINAISFKKGCYTGQEVIARMHYKGMGKKRLYHVQLNATAIEPSNVSDYAAGNSLFDGEKAIAEIILSAINEQNQIEVLAILSDELAQQKNLTIQVKNKAEPLKLSILELPYDEQ